MRFKVPDMSCGHCKATIEQAIHAAGGKAEINLDTHTVEVEGLDSETAQNAIREAGYSPNPD
ncbi:heavy-metal-associated domain-containing protein [Paracoccus pacificus]|uniref:Heavy-metal-associated domain-containing protein n=1 Tax=Paracoccus pacificus TaxID=1463598 RepID=A0ABW4RCL8_9RHOB